MAAALEVEEVEEEVVATAELVDELVVGTGLADDVLDTGTEMASEVAGLDDGEVDEVGLLPSPLPLPLSFVSTGGAKVAIYRSARRRCRLRAIVRSVE